MQTSIFLAQLIGPMFVVIGAGLLVSPGDYRVMAEQFLASRALIYIAGLMALVPGLAIVLTHNVWVFDWRLIITVLGWLGVIGGAFRLLMPRQVVAVGSAMLARQGWMRGGGIGVIALGAILSFYGYMI
jgi:hypothetical protein